MPSFDPGYYLVGSWISESRNHSVYLYEYSEGGEFEESPVQEKDLIILDQTTNIGRQGDPFSTHLRGELQLKILDQENHFRDRFRLAVPGKFYLKSIQGNRTYIGFPVADFIGGKFWKKYNERTFVFSDGITILKSQSNSYTNYIQLGDFIYNILKDIGIELDVNIVMDYQPESASGQSGILPQQIQILPSDFVHNIVNPNKYELFIAVLKHFGFQIWQENNEWWVVQRNIRDNTPSLYKRSSTGWSDLAYPEDIEIKLSDLRSDRTQDIDFELISKYERTIKKRDQEFITLDPQFDPSNWTSGEPDFWVGSGNVTNLSLPDRLNFDDRSPVRSQELLRILNAGDTINLRLKAEYELFDSLADGTYNFEIASIEAIAVNAGSSYWLNENGSWSSSFSGIGNEVIVSGFGYNTSLNKDLDVNSDPLPSGFEGYIKINLQLTGDTGAFVTIDPIQYEIVKISDVELSDIISEVNYSGRSINSSVGNSKTETVYGNDELVLSAHPSILFFNGSSWERITDWNSRYYQNRELNTIIVSNELRQRSINHNGYQLMIPFYLDIKLSQTIVFEEEPLVKFIPHYISYLNKENSTIVHISKLVDTDEVALTAFES